MHVCAAPHCLDWPSLSTPDTPLSPDPIQSVKCAGGTGPVYAQLYKFDSHFQRVERSTSIRSNAKFKIFRRYKGWRPRTYSKTFTSLYVFLWSVFSTSIWLHSLLLLLLMLSTAIRIPTCRASCLTRDFTVDKCRLRYPPISLYPDHQKTLPFSAKNMHTTDCPHNRLLQSSL